MASFVAIHHSPQHYSLFFFFNDTATTEIYTLSLHDALPISSRRPSGLQATPHRVSGGSESRRTRTQVPAAGSHSRMALSHPLLASVFPSGLQPTPPTVQPCPRNTLDRIPSAITPTITSVSEP